MKTVENLTAVVEEKENTVQKLLHEKAGKEKALEDELLVMKNKCQQIESLEHEVTSREELLRLANADLQVKNAEIVELKSAIEQ